MPSLSAVSSGMVADVGVAWLPVPLGESHMQHAGASDMFCCVHMSHTQSPCGKLAPAPAPAPPPAPVLVAAPAMRRRAAARKSLALPSQATLLPPRHCGVMVAVGMLRA